MNESTLVNSLVKCLRAHFRDGVVIKHSDKMTSGVPDLSVVWNGFTTWIEVKYANPGILDKGVQREMIKRLAKAGSCIYVIYDAIRTETYIVHPMVLTNWHEEYVMVAEGFKHEMIAQYISKLHSPGF